MSGGRYHDHDPLRDELVAQRRVLYWMVMNLRLTNRRMYMAAMNVLRSVYLPSYQSHVRPGYSSDPFPLSSLAPLSDRERRDSASTTSSKARSIPDFPLEAMSLASLQRETAVFDMYIAAKAREDMWLDETELHVEREETFTDLFEFNQPRARLEDLIRHYGTRSGSVSISLHPSTPTTSSPSNGSLPFTLLSISFSQRKAGLVRADEYGRNKRTIVAVERRRDDTLERVAKRLVGELDRLRSERRCYGG